MHLQDNYSQRINPEFHEISLKCAKAKKKRQQIDQKKQELSQNMEYFERTNHSLQMRLSKRKKQLQLLKSVRQRHLKDIAYKIQRQNKNNQMLEQLKSRSTNARLNNRTNIFYAIQSSKMSKKNLKKAVAIQLSEIKKSKQLQQQSLKMYYQQKSKQKQHQKTIGKLKINQFFKRKNKVLLNSYRQTIRNQQMKSQKSASQIDQIQIRSNKLAHKIQGKKRKINKIQNQISKFKEQQQISKATIYNSIDLSRLTKKSVDTNIFKTTIKQISKTLDAEELPNQKLW